MPALLITVLLALVPPGDATSLAPDPASPVGASPASEAAAPDEPAPPEPEPPLLPAAAIMAAGAAMAAALRWGRPDGPAPGDALALRGDPLVVFVPGHGNAASDFDDLAALMDLEPEDYRVFDYRWSAETGDPVHASRAVGIDDTADTLSAFLAGLSVAGRPVYLVGFSKGGAGIAEMLSRWDRGESPRAPGVYGAALLDPPIAAGFRGAVQSIGFWISPVPDDGGYDPLDCGWFRGCTDRREHLGDRSDVEVVVLRNPKAGITNFDDRPEGLRVLDVPDEGRGPLASVIHNPFSYPMRVAEAHDAVLHDRRVADCIRAEMREPGSCRIPAVTGAGAEGAAGSGGGAFAAG